MRIPIDVASIAVAALVSVAAGGVILARARGNGSNPESERRLLIERKGRLTEGFFISYDEHCMYYSWTWRGVEYNGSQDIRGLGISAVDVQRSVGTAIRVRLLPENPYNSIVVSENWTGL